MRAFGPVKTITSRMAIRVKKATAPHISISQCPMRPSCGPRSGRRDPTLHYKSLPPPTLPQTNMKEALSAASMPDSLSDAGHQSCLMGRSVNANCSGKEEGVSFIQPVSCSRSLTLSLSRSFLPPPCQHQ